ncbi:antiviral reverse transcriptase Drt3b [Natronocella acetinitrilica]|uniref:antiviral reverse transcriptase Drt3b n=1 Tax=Natronocella acetinitrilica TaxID=414046 RepID=UPI00209E7235|nr:antiviral reverse transcriptase Drt3b [Natronocella acetinitrilica]
MTETLPYECPFIFSNDFFYARLRKELAGKTDALTKEFLQSGDLPYTVPYSYEASLGGGRFRTLSVLHPQTQLDVREFYKRYFSMIIDRCGISPVSIRRPARIASAFYEKELLKTNDEIKSDEVEAQPEDVHRTHRRFSSSFFVYKSFARLFEFYNSSDFLNLEKRYERFTSFDISKCFYNIYSHSIAWAVKSRSFAKVNTRATSFENDFDKLMQKGNFSETNGIVVGPEVSRIFAEIILQDIDMRVAHRLRQRKLYHRQQYEIRRYIDDYFLFTNDEHTENVVIQTHETVLADYKLFLNREKLKKTTRPFSTPISAAKHELLDLLEGVFADLFVSGELAKHGGHDYSPNRSYARHRQGSVHVREYFDWSWTPRKLLDRYKATVKAYDIRYEDVSGFFLGIIRHRLLQAFTRLCCAMDRDVEYNSLNRLIGFIVEVVFFVVMTDVRVRPVDIAAQILVLLKEALADYDPPLIQIFEEAVQIDFARSFLSGGEESVATLHPLEFCSLLVTVSNVTPNWKVDPSTLLEFWQAVSSRQAPVNETRKFPYFEAVSIVYFCKYDPDYDRVREEVANSLVTALSEPHPRFHASLTLALFDFMSCPFLAESQKRQIASEAWKSTFMVPSAKGNKVSEFITFTSSKTWFVDWESEINVRRALFKKELRASY